MKENWILKYFPVPAYLRMPAMGIDISDKSFKYIELKKDKDFFYVSRYGTKVIPNGIIESGEIKQKDKLIDFLKSVNKELGVEFINVSLPEEKAFISRIKLPFMKENDIRGALEFQMEEHIPLSLSDAIFDFEVIKKEKDKNGNILISMSAYPKSLVEDYRDVFMSAGFMPLAFEMETQSFARAMVPSGDNDSYFLVDFGQTRISFAIVSEGRIQFTSTIKIGGEKLDEALAKNLNIDTFKAEDLKKEKGLRKAKNNEKVFNALLSIISVVKDEINRHIIYWNSHLNELEKNNKRIKKILLCGGDSNLFGFPEFISYELKLPVELSNPWINIISFENYVPEIELRESLIYTVALGLALRSFGFEK
ncbi:pilus assembly protein PilM [Patescibacteria group bacterium]|nr:pilus assembly protein PilM [Patescibacteria group bacterium]